MIWAEAAVVVELSTTQPMQFPQATSQSPLAQAELVLQLELVSLVVPMVVTLSLVLSLPLVAAVVLRNIATTIHQLPLVAPAEEVLAIPIVQVELAQPAKATQAVLVADHTTQAAAAEQVVWVKPILPMAVLEFHLI